MRIYWLCWLVLGFGVPEGIAIATKHYNNTFSDWIWRVFDVMPGQTLFEWRFVHVLLLLFMLWLFVHLCFGLWR